MDEYNLELGGDKYCYDAPLGSSKAQYQTLLPKIITHHITPKYQNDLIGIIFSVEDKDIDYFSKRIAGRTQLPYREVYIEWLKKECLQCYEVLKKHKYTLGGQKKTKDKIVLWLFYFYPFSAIITGAIELSEIPKERRTTAVGIRHNMRLVHDSFAREEVRKTFTEEEKTSAKEYSKLLLAKKLPQKDYYTLLGWAEVIKNFPHFFDLRKVKKLSEYEFREFTLNAAIKWREIHDKIQSQFPRRREFFAFSVVYSLLKTDKEKVMKSREDICKVLGISKQTSYNWQKHF